jgi:SAM-dependent methyltransferase
VPNYYDVNYRRFLPAGLDAPIIDIGCGEGDFVRYLSALGYRNITAVDVDSKSVERLGSLPGVTAVEARADAQFVQTLDGGYALIVVKQMIYYLDRRQAPPFVAALARALTPDGRLLVEIFNGSLLSSRFTELKDPGIVTAYTENGLCRLLEWNGCEVVSLFGVRTGSGSLRAKTYRGLQHLWFALYRLLLILERGRDGELPTIAHKSLVAVARRR